jgi:DNA transformation protein
LLKLFQVKLEKLTDIPNIGDELSYRLNNVGILNYKHLAALGSCKVFQLIFAEDPSICINMLYALEGAIQHIRWHKLDASKKEELKHFFKMLKRAET